jgi:hypothetical protein
MVLILEILNPLRYIIFAVLFLFFLMYLSNHGEKWTRISYMLGIIIGTLFIIMSLNNS